MQPNNRYFELMAQVSMTVRMDSQLKQTFDALCAEFGMSVNTAINIFAKAVVKTRSIPFEIKAGNDDAYRKGVQAFYALREQAKANALQDMTLDEINEEIKQARAERKEKKK